MTLNLLAPTFTKQEKLCSTKQLDLLFEKGKGFYVSPFRFVFIETEQNQLFPAQIVVSVSKRNFKKAVDRNRIKRLIRENYRLNKSNIYQHLHSKNKNIHLGIIFICKELPDFEITKSALQKGIEKLITLV
jgi:ribonuclease P protein component